MNKLHDINLEGIGKVNGGKYKDIKISGIGTILDDVICEEFCSEGICKIKGKIKCDNIFVEGTFNSYGIVEANNKVSIKGQISSRESIQGQEVNIEGKIKTDGLLSGDKIKVIFMGRSYVKEIGGEEISISQNNKSFINRIIMPNKLTSEFIEGDTIELENTECEIVRGKNITIKSGCSIKKIEYTGEIIIDENSRVEEVTKL